MASGLGCIWMRRCTAGETVACTEGTYNNKTDQDLATACQPCPEHATSVAASASIEQCKCLPGYYDAIEGSDVRCATCPSGSDCAQPPADGISLSTLPIKAGYYRHSNRSEDVRRCPDAAVNCGGASTCEESTSGCRGTIDGVANCYAELHGVFCQLCAPREDAALVYYRAAEALLVCLAQTPLAATSGLASASCLAQPARLRWRVISIVAVSAKSAGRGLWRCCAR